MKKTYTANIGGLVYHIEEDAYDRLNNYLRSLHVAFKNTAGGEEIIADIELRISELFQQKLNPGKQVITMADVEDVIRTMGRPEDYMDEPDPDSHWSDSTNSFRSTNKRRIYRDPDNKVVAGVCSGISAYFGWDPIILRLVFAVMFIFYGTGVLLYILLIIIIPQAKTTAEKLQMHGDPVNVDNISKKVSESFRSAYDSLNQNDAGARISGFFRNFFELLANLLHGIAKVVEKIVGVAFIIAGVVGILIILSLLFGINEAFVVSHNGFSLGGIAQILSEHFFESPLQRVLLYGGLGLVVGIPLLAFLFWGIQILSTRKIKTMALSISMIVLWVVGCFMLLSSSVGFAGAFRAHASSNINIPIEQPSDSLIILTSNLDYNYASLPFGRHWRFDNNFFLRGVTFSGTDSTYQIELATSTLTIDQNASDSLVKLIATVETSGTTKREAEKYAGNIKPNVTSSGDSLYVSRFIDLPKGDKLRGQQISYTLLVPVGVRVKLSSSVEDLIYDIPNVTNTLDSRMVGETWIMTKKGLSCYSCTDGYEQDSY